MAGKVVTGKQECGRKETGRWQEGDRIKLGKGQDGGKILKLER